MSKNYLLEIGLEELPATYIKDAMIQLEGKFKDLFEEEKINFQELKSYSTPRRLSLLIEGLDEGQEDTEELLRGPSRQIAYGDDEEPSKALLGFLRGQKLDLEDVFIDDHKGVEYVFVRKLKKGRQVSQILEENLGSIITSLIFPKSMKWGGRELRFARPIRWILSLLDDQVVDFNFYGIPVSNKTRGHRFLGSQDIEVGHVDQYLGLLRDNFVEADFSKRREKIEFSASRMAREVGGKLLIDDQLLDEVTNLVEYPTPMIGKIKPEYLKLPIDVIITPMKEHLRYFPLMDNKGRLLPYFIAIRNGDDKYLDNVIKGNEKVLGARLEDAKFFYEEDISLPLESYVEDLKGIIFQDKLGTIYDKTVRVKKLAEKIAGYLAVGGETKKNLARASYLSKADLVTKMVTEFTELQGKTGMEYAKLSEENEIVSLAIYEHYLPRYSGDSLPSTTAGSILSIADKMDSIAGLFAIGIEPTGSQDPFALRRSALGIINIIIDRRLSLSLMELIEFALYIYVEDQGLVFDYDEIKDNIKKFFYGRIRNMFLDMKFSYDLIDAVLATDKDDIYDLKIRMEKISTWQEEVDMSEILSAFNRVANLSEKATSTEVKRDLLTEDEFELYNAYNAIENKLKSLIDDKDYDKALELLVTLKNPIDNFFDKVMVMVDDEEIRNNRLALIKKIHISMLSVADLSKLVSS